MINIALIPARSGSTGILNKNLKIVGGISLVSRSVKHALESDIFDSIIVSTDSFDIASGLSTQLNRREFDEVEADSLIKISENMFIHKRPRELALSDTLISDLLFHLSPRLVFHYLWLLQPTSPFRHHKEFREIMTIIQREEDLGRSWSSIISVANVNGFHPDRMYRIENNILDPIFPFKKVDNIPRQKLESIFIKDGGYYILKYENLKHQIMLGSKIIPYERRGFYTINIDTLSDLILAQSVSERNLCE